MKQVERIAGLGIWKEYSWPMLFCTIHDGAAYQNPVSVITVKRLSEKEPLASNGVRFCAFESLEAYDAEREAIPGELIVVLFDYAGGGRLFRPLCRDFSGRSFPEWAGEVLWGIRINAALPERRITSVVQQAAADYHANFLTNLQRGRLPFGVPPSEEAAARRKEKKGHREQRRFLGRLSWRSGRRSPLFV